MQTRESESAERKEGWGVRGHDALELCGSIDGVQRCFCRLLFRTLVLILLVL